MKIVDDVPNARSRLTALCRIVIAAGIGCFAAGWVIGAWIESDAIDAPAGIYDRPLRLIRGGVRYITAPEEQVMAIVIPGMFVSVAFSMCAGVLMAALDEARRDEERARSEKLPF